MGDAPSGPEVRLRSRGHHSEALARAHEAPMTLTEGKRRGAVPTPSGWELTIAAFRQQPASTVRWPYSDSKARFDGLSTAADTAIEQGEQLGAEWLPVLQEQLDQVLDGRNDSHERRGGLENPRAGTGNASVMSGSDA